MSDDVKGLHRFSGEEDDPGKALKKWQTWAKAKMMTLKDLKQEQRGPWLLTKNQKSPEAKAGYSPALNNALSSSMCCRRDGRQPESLAKLSPSTSVSTILPAKICLNMACLNTPLLQYNNGSKNRLLDSGAKTNKNY